MKTFGVIAFTDKYTCMSGAYYFFSFFTTNDVLQFIFSYNGCFLFLYVLGIGLSSYYDAS